MRFPCRQRKRKSHAPSVSPMNSRKAPECASRAQSPAQYRQLLTSVPCGAAASARSTNHGNVICT